MTPRLVARVVGWLCRHGRLLLAVAFVLAVPAAYRTAGLYLHLRSELEALLPPDAPSVRAIHELRLRDGGRSFLGVVVDTGDPQNLPAAERLLDDLAERVRRYPPELRVAQVSEGIAQERAFFERHAGLYLTLPELTELRDRVAARRDWEVSRALGMLFDDAPPPALGVEELRKKHEQTLGMGDHPGDRFVSSDGRTAVLLVATNLESGTSVGGALLRRVRADLQAMGGPEAYAPALRVGFAADIAARVEELDALVVDLTLSSLLVVAAVGAVLVLYYRWWSALVVLGVPLLCGTVVAFGVCTLPPLSLRELNSNTAFLGAIIVGNGVNTGIILLARHQEERRRGRRTFRAIVAAVTTTGRATGTAALAASLAYGSLLVTRFRGFNQFGWIGAAGMLLCWLFTMALVPPLLAFFDRDDGIVGHRTGAGSLPGVARVLAGVEHLTGAHPRKVLLVAGSLTAAALVVFAGVNESWIETDYGKLRLRTTWNDGEGYWGAKMETVITRYLTPAVLLTESPEQTRRVAEEVRAAVRGSLAQDIGSVLDFEDVLPPDQPRKLAVLREVSAMLTPHLRGELAPADRRRLEDMLSPDALRPLTAKDLPAMVVDGMREDTGRIDRAVLVFPRPSPRAWQASTLRAITLSLRDAAARATLPGERVPPVAGALMLSYDLLQTIGRDGPVATAVAFFLVLAVIATAFGAARSTAFAAGSLVVAALWVIGAMRLFQLKLNFANFVVFPITFGIGADYAVNVVGRYRADGERDVLHVIRSTGGAVVLASLTTVIGYSSLLLARNRALFLFGLVAVMGELASLSTSIGVLPAALRVLGRGSPRPGLLRHRTGPGGELQQAWYKRRRCPRRC